jgi:transposase
VSQVARELDVRPEQLRTWASRLREIEGKHPAMVETPEEELRRLRRENAMLKKEREFAKKVAVYFATESR